MTPTDGQLTAAFDKGIHEGSDTLVGLDRDYCLIQDFILEWENGFLSGYLYNRIPDFDLVRAAIDSMRRHSLGDIAAILTEALQLFDGYQETSPPTTWGAVLERYDPSGRLAELDRRIGQLQNYRLKQ